MKRNTDRDVVNDGGKSSHASDEPGRREERRRLVTVIAFALFLSIMAMMMGGCNETPSGNATVPTAARTFITHYFEGYEVESCNVAGGVTTIILKDGPMLKFNADDTWTTVDGLGLPLPQIFVYDQFPDALYRYLEETENVENVYAVSRTAFRYDVKLFESNISYDVDTRRVTGEV